MAGKVCHKCGKEQLKKFSKQCSFCGSSLSEPTKEEKGSPGEAESDRFAFNRKLLETMVILASIDGKIGESELETLIDFTLRLGNVFAGFDTKPLFEALITEIQPLSSEKKIQRLEENGSLFRKAFSTEFNKSFISDFEKMILADGKITENEANSINVLKKTMLPVNVDNASKPAEPQLSQSKAEFEHLDHSADKPTLRKKLLETMVILAIIDGNLGEKEKDILAKFAYRIKKIFPDGFDFDALLKAVVTDLGPLDGAQRTLRLVGNGKLFHKAFPMDFNETLLSEFEKMITADGKITENEALCITALQMEMFPTDKDQLFKKLLETMVILASIDGRIGNEEKHTLVVFVLRTKTAFEEVYGFPDGFDFAPLFEAVVTEIASLSGNARVNRLTENGHLFHRAFPIKVNESFFCNFKNMILADGVITENEEVCINALKAAMFS